jgi:alpha-N-arabinofuranosidase
VTTKPSAVVTAAAFLLVLASAVAAVASPSPIGEWSFKSVAGARVPDRTGNGHDAAIVGGAASAVDGGLRFGGGAYADVAAAVIDTSRSYTVTALVRPNTVDGYQTYVSIDGDDVSAFFLQLRADTHAFGITRFDRDSTRSGAAIAGCIDPARAGAWYHLAAVYDADAGTLSFYVDGRLESVARCAPGWLAKGHLVIGRGKFAGKATDFVSADIADVRVYQQALTASEIDETGTLNRSPSVLTIDAGHPGAKVSPTLYGLMTEEINHSYDGGLYGELIQNRAFADNANRPDHWSFVSVGAASGSIALDNSWPVNASITTSLKLQADSCAPGSRAGAANDGYWGIPVRPNTTYHVSLYAKGSPGFDGPLDVDLESTGGGKVYASATIPSISAGWKRYAVTLRTGDEAASETNRFVVSISKPGAVWLGLVSLFPPTYHNRANGTRIDLMEKLAAMHPAFLRLPGGNYVEGNTIAERFAWKNTIGPLAGRAGHESPWGYRSSDGLGLLEFLEWCEDLKMQPVLAVYAGYSLDGEYVKPGPDLQPYVQDALDEIQYVTGSTDSKWGAERARDGHPAAFPLQYVEIGNEDGFDRSGSYDGRFAQFYDAIKAAYPRLRLIATARVTSRTPDVVDEHFYPSPSDFERDYRHYDRYDRNGPKIFVGEWASQEGRPTPDLGAALGDAAWMIGMERNSDVVVMQSYAPLFVNVSGAQWGTNLIGYDALTSYGSPSYYAEVLFRDRLGDTIVPTSVADLVPLQSGATRDSRTGAIYLKVVNALPVAQTETILLKGVHAVDPVGNATVIASTSTADTNTLADPLKIVPMEVAISGLGRRFSHTFPAYSITVLTIRCR